MNCTFAFETMQILYYRFRQNAHTASLTSILSEYYSIAWNALQMETLEQQIGHLSDKQDRQQDKPDKMKDKTDKLPDKTGKLPGKQEIPAYRPGRLPDTFVSGEDETTPQLPPAFGKLMSCSCVALSTIVWT